MSEIRIGNTIIRHQVTYLGSPFQSKTVNVSVLGRMFPHGQAIETQSTRDKEEDAAQIQMKKDEFGTEGYNTRCLLSGDKIVLDHLLPPQSLGQLAVNIFTTFETIAALVARLREAYELANEPETYSNSWTAATQGVPCVHWLKAHCQLQPVDINVSEHVAKDVEVDWRPVGTTFAFHVLPSAAKTLPAEMKARLETINKLQVMVPSSEDWAAGTATVAMELQSAKPGIYVDAIRRISTP